jgi:hypothetical protein
MKTNITVGEGERKVKKIKFDVKMVTIQTFASIYPFCNNSVIARAIDEDVTRISSLFDRARHQRSRPIDTKLSHKMTAYIFGELHALFFPENVLTHYITLEYLSKLRKTFSIIKTCNAAGFDGTYINRICKLQSRFSLTDSRAATISFMKAFGPAFIKKWDEDILAAAIKESEADPKTKWLK